MTRTAYYCGRGPAAGASAGPAFSAFVRRTLKRPERMVGGLPAGARFSLLDGSREFTATGQTRPGRHHTDLRAVVVGPAGGEHELSAFARVRVHYLP